MKNKFFKLSFANSAVNKLLLSCLLISLVTYLSTVSSSLIAGKIVGNNALSAINLINPLYNYANFFSGMIGIGSSLMYFRFIGAYKKDRANEIFGQSIILSISIGILIFIVMSVIETPYLDSLNISNELRYEAEQFWKFEKVVMALLPSDFVLFEMLCTDTKLILIADIAFYVTGIGSSIIFTNLFGTMGTSMGMTVGIIICDLILCTHFLSKKNEFKFKFHFSFKDIKEMLNLSLVDSSTYLDSGLLIMFINTYVLKNFSEDMLPVTAVMVTILDIIIVFDCVGSAFSPVAEVFLGENNFNDEKDVARYSLFISQVFGVLVTILFIVAAPLFPQFFRIEDPIQADLLVKVIRLFAPSMLLYSLSYMIISHYIAIRKISLAVIIEWTKALIAPAICILIFGGLFGFKGIWGSFFIAQILCALCFNLSIKLFSKRNKSIWLLDDNAYPTFSCSYYANKENVINARNDIEKFLIDTSVNKSIINKIIMTIEDMTNIVIDKNPNRKVIIQYNVFIHDDCIYLYERDNGEIYDLTNPDNNITSFNEYIFNCISGTFNDKQYLISIDYNRSVFCYRI